MDYNKLKVTELKEELKKRGIPTTKLTRKQDIIDRLEEEDGKTGEDATEQDYVTDAMQEPDAGVAEAEEAAEAGVAPDETIVKGAPATAGEAVEPAPIPTAEAEAAAVEVDEASLGAPEAEIAEVPAQQQTSDDPVMEDPAVSEVQDAPVSTSEPAISPMVEPATPLQQATELASEDSRKRKRRSVTPPVSQDSVQKKLKQDEEPVVHLEREKEVELAPINGEDVKDVRMEDSVEDKTETKIAPENGEDVMDTAAPSSVVSPKVMPSPGSRRFKNLIGPSPTPVQDVPELTSTEVESVSTPSLHSATAAIYIRDLVRPMKDETLREHLNQIATPPGSETEDVITTLHIDALRSHAFVLFTSINAAARARNALHARVWPAEPTRRPLWVDFIPEEKVDEWISQEVANGGTRPSQAKRWEVLYSTQDSGSVTVSLVDGTSPPANGSRPFTGAVPTGPRNSGISTAPLPPPPSEPLATRITDAPVETPSQSFLELDKLFRSTTSKPKIYWLPTPADIVDKRLDELEHCTSRDWDPKRDARMNKDGMGRGLDQLKRYTFEDGDVLVDGGPEYGGGRAFARGGGESYRGGGRGYGGRGRGGDRYRG